MLTVVGMVIFAEPLKLVAVPVTAPEIAIVLAVWSVVAVVALPDKAPVNVLALIGSADVIAVVETVKRLVPPVEMPIWSAAGW